MDPRDRGLTRFHCMLILSMHFSVVMIVIVMNMIMAILLCCVVCYLKNL